MKRKKSLILILLLFLLLTGCAHSETPARRLRGYVEDRVAQRVMRKSGITEDADYQRYLELEEDGRLNPDGSYTGDEGEYQEREGNIHVTFMRNAYISVAYYADAAHTLPLERECYLLPGDCLFYSVPRLTDPPGSLYRFQDFHAWEADGEREVPLTVDKMGMVLTIPKTVHTGELMIAPLGEFQNRTVTLFAYTTDSNGEEREVRSSCEWHIGQRVFHNDSVTLGPSDLEEIRFYYDNDEYYFVRSEPEAYYQDDTEGFVIFPLLTGDERKSGFSVELRHYYTLRAEGDLQGFYDSADLKRYADSASEPVLLRHGDSVFIDLKKGYTLRSNEAEIPAPEILSGGRYRYTLTVPDTSAYDTIHLLISAVDSDTYRTYRQRIVGHGLVELRDAASGTVFPDGALVGKTQNVTVRVTADEGWYVSGKNTKDGVYQETMQFSRYSTDIDRLLREHPIKKLIHVTIDPSDAHGNGVFKLDGEVMQGDAALSENADLVLEYTLTDPALQIDQSEDWLGWFKSWINGEAGKQITLRVPVSPELEGTTLRPSDYVSLVKREGAQG